MRFALVNPNWDFKGSTYFGCQEPHVPLELMFAFDQVRAAGHEPLLVDAQTEGLSLEETRRRIVSFQPDFLVIPTAPSYLFWRCPPPELRVPMEWFRGLDSAATKVVIGPHASATPAAALRKTGAQVALRGEPDQTLPQLAGLPWEQVAGCCFNRNGEVHISPSFGVADMRALGPLDFRNYRVEAHRHRHHVFTDDQGLGAELEFARGCPWSCTFCNKTLFRNKFRERSVATVLKEVDTLISRGVQYIYFIDEIFGVGRNVRRLLEGIAERPVKIGFQTRIDLWDEESLDLLGRAHCISMECGVESITEEGREGLNKNCRMDTGRISELLIYARSRIPWVQANLILTDKDDRGQIREWQEHLRHQGVWVSEPVPMFPFPGSPLYQQTFAAPPDDEAWERAHHYYTTTFAPKGYSDIQEQKPLPIEDLENAHLSHR
ncbi:MAG TPA: TIGR04295 family B12-binding domain-containing radical SAM protein [Candidatus Limnocylindrales bacterium]|nr:TIGR04295 family B12-binding domain-containing radical SAM protein [Candidatus Limnocylindrales bacterium]